MLRPSSIRFHAALAVILLFSGQARSATYLGELTDPSGNTPAMLPIFIESPAAFFVGLSTPGRPFDFDPIIYLFKADGAAVAASRGGALFVSGFGGMSGGIKTPLNVGSYLLAVTVFNDQAMDSSGQNLFSPPPASSDVSVPSGAGPLDHFTQLGLYPGEVTTGTFAFILSGAVAVPEPSTFVLFGVGMLLAPSGLVVNKRRRAKLIYHVVRTSA